MTRLIFALLVLICTTNVRAQFTIVDIKDNAEEAAFVFPVLASQKQPAIAKKINQSLQTNELGMAVAPTTKDPLEKLKNEDEYYYRVVCNNERVFSLEITTGHNGAGSHYQFRNYSFDARTGNAIHLNNLFAATAQVKVRQAVYKVWKESIKPNLGDATFADEYKECLAGAAGTTELEISRMVVTDNAVDFWAGSCLDGTAWRADRTLGPHHIPYEQLLSMLTPYGLSVFVGPAPSANALHQRLIKGKVDGKYDVSLTFAAPDGSETFKGVLVYDKYNAPIQLSGTLTGDKVVFHELDASGTPVSEFDCMWDGKGLKGTFKALKSGKVMPFAAAMF